MDLTAAAGGHQATLQIPKGIPRQGRVTYATQLYTVDQMIGWQQVNLGRQTKTK